MSGAKTARRSVVQRRIGGAEMALTLIECTCKGTVIGKKWEFQEVGTIGKVIDKNEK